jgi:hypothetical protein
MAIARRWDEPEFAAARAERPDLPLREAQRLLEATATGCPRVVTPQPIQERSAAFEALVEAQAALAQVQDMEKGQRLAGAELGAAAAALQTAYDALFKRWR